MNGNRQSSSGSKMTSSSAARGIAEQNVMQPKIKPDADRPGRSTNQLAFMYKTLMPAIFKLKISDAFKNPIDPNSLDFPNLYACIMNPMDLKTIRERLRNRFYQSSAECIRDFQLIICNASVCSKPESSLVLQANELEAAFLLKLIEMPKVEVEVNGLTKPVATPVKQTPVTDVKEPKRSSTRSTKPVNRYIPPVSTVLAVETKTPVMKKKCVTSSSSSSSSSSLSSSSSSSSTSSCYTSSDSDDGNRENCRKNKLQHQMRGIDAKIYKLEKQRKRLMRKLKKMSKKEDKKKSQKSSKRGRKRKTSASSKPEEISAKSKKKKVKATLPVPKKRPVTAVKGKGKRAVGQPYAITTQDRVELREMLGKLKTNDLSMLMEVVGSSDEMDVGTMKPEKFQVVKEFVKSKLATVGNANITSPSVSPQRFAPMTNGVAHATLQIATETLESPGSPGSEVPSYNFEDNR